MDVSVESKVFGIGVESYTTGSSEFYLNYAASRKICCLLDTGHFHPTENVADKISSMYCFYDKLAFHVSRPVRWNSDHVLKLNDDLQDVADELVKCNGLTRNYIGLDYFDASINRVAAMVIGARNMEKALLKALLTPWDLLRKPKIAMTIPRFWPFKKNSRPSLGERFGTNTSSVKAWSTTRRCTKKLRNTRRKSFLKDN